MSISLAASVNGSFLEKLKNKFYILKLYDPKECIHPPTKKENNFILFVLWRTKQKIYKNSDFCCLNNMQKENSCLKCITELWFTPKLNG